MKTQFFGISFNRDVYDLGFYDDLEDCVAHNDDMVIFTWEQFNALYKEIDWRINEVKGR